jgi:hypothetical protein
MAKKPKKWMQKAVKHEGALRATAKRLGLIKGDEKLTAGILSKLMAHAKKADDTTLMRRVNLARTFAKERPQKKAA